MESLQILQWCQENDLPREAINEALTCYKDGSRYLPNREAQTDIPKYRALVKRLTEIQEQFKALQAKTDLTPAEEAESVNLKEEWKRLRQIYMPLVQKLYPQRELLKFTARRRQKSQEYKRQQEAAEDERMAQQSPDLQMSSANAAFPRTPENGNQQLATTRNPS